MKSKLTQTACGYIMRKGPQTNMPQKVGSREELISENKQSGHMEPKKPGLNRI